MQIRGAALCYLPRENRERARRVSITAWRSNPSQKEWSLPRDNVEQFRRRHGIVHFSHQGTQRLVERRQRFCVLRFSSEVAHFPWVALDVEKLHYVSVGRANELPFRRAHGSL